MLPSQLLPLLYDDYLGIAREGPVFVPEPIVDPGQYVRIAAGRTSWSRQSRASTSYPRQSVSGGGYPRIISPLPSQDVPIPDSMTLTLTPSFNRIFVQLDATPDAETYIEAFTEYHFASEWRNGTYLKKRYDADEYYGNCFNIPENTSVRVRTTVQVKSTDSDETLAEYIEVEDVETLSSETPQVGGGTPWFVDPSVGVSGDGSVGNPFKWLTSRVWQPGDTIVIMNGNFDGGVTTQRWIGNNSGTVQGTADNWIRVVPYSVIDPGNGDAEKEKFKITLALNGPWTETSGGSGVWSMSTDKPIGVVRDETTGWQLYHHNNYNSGGTAYHPEILTGFDPADFPQLGGSEVQGWYIDLAGDLLYIRTHDGNEPEADRYIGGYGPGLVVRNASYVSIEDFTFEMCGSLSGSTLLSPGLSVSAATSTTEKTCHHVYVKRCLFKDCTATVPSSNTVANCKASDVLFDECEWERLGVKEYFIDRVDYSQDEPYHADFGYQAVKSAFWARAAIIAVGAENLTIRNPTVYGYDLHQDNGTATYAAAPFNGGKNLDMHGGSCSASVVGVAEFGSPPTVVGEYINAALWDMQIDDSAEPIAMSPVNSGPVWMFATGGDGTLHTPFKIGLQSGSYSTDNGHGFKIIANNSFALAGHCDSETLGMMRFQGAYSGVEGANNVIKGYESTESSPLGNWFSYADPSTGMERYDVKADRLNRWDNGLIYIKSVVAPLTPRTPKLRWDGFTYDILAGTAPPATEIVWSNYDFFWSGGTDIDPFPVSVAAGLNPAVTRTSVYVRGITDLAGDDDGNPVSLAELPIGRFPLRSP